MWVKFDGPAAASSATHACMWSAPLVFCCCVVACSRSAGRCRFCLLCGVSRDNLVAVPRCTSKHCRAVRQKSWSYFVPKPYGGPSSQLWSYYDTPVHKQGLITQSVAGALFPVSLFLSQERTFARQRRADAYPARLIESAHPTVALHVLYYQYCLVCTDVYVRFFSCSDFFAPE